ncbi:Actin-related protein 2/3 complex subunit 1A [Orobanche hederae]
MAAVSVQQFAQCITCHAWSPDHSMIAFCPNNTEVHIYTLLGGKWEKIHVLQKHDQIVSGIDWGISSSRIVSVSHDRNSYVWSQEASEWVPTLVILRLNRAALCVQWSPKENKFAVGSGAKTVCICYYEQENNWWVSKIIRKRHDSSVTSVAWHPDNILLATTSTDGKCRVFSTFIKGVDTKNSTGSSSDSKFGEQIMQLDLSIIQFTKFELKRTEPYRGSPGDNGYARHAFMEGKNILDSFFVANEVVDEYKCRSKRSFVFKIDFAEAYNHVDWDFLNFALSKKGGGDGQVVAYIRSASRL